MRLFLRKLRDWATILRSNVFDHHNYALHYLTAPSRAPVAALHYVFHGEAMGLRPNGFYDPSFVKETIPGGLAAYLREPRFWDLQTSPHFDGGWYRKTYAANVEGSINPLADFLNAGFAQDRNGSPAFDSAYFKHYPAHYYRDKRDATAKLLWKDPPVPTTLAALRDAQQAFRDAISLTAHAALPQARAPFLVFVQAGGSFDAPWLRERQGYDVLINYYADLSAAQTDADYVFQQRGTKTTAIARLLADTDILQRYEAALFLDDDVELTARDIAALFAARERHGLDLLQPSLSPQSATYFDLLKQPQAGGATRAVSAVEIMAPLISKRALDAFGWAFSEAVSGWGVDLLLSKLVRERFGETVGLVGDVVVKHERPVDLNDGAFYRALARQGIDPTSEVIRLIETYRIESPLEAFYPIDTSSADAGSRAR